MLLGGLAAAVQPDRVERAPGREYRLMEVIPDADVAAS
jgi:hypothetical protein